MIGNLMKQVSKTREKTYPEASKAWFICINGGGGGEDFACGPLQ